jgi:hypothetical protein
MNKPSSKGFVLIKIVPQYGPEWCKHVLSGGRVIRGNILILADSK